MVAWLHLSDWHQGEMLAGDAWRRHREEILKCLLSDIENRVAIDRELQNLDFVAFSGDLAFGGKPAEYADALEFFIRPLLRAAGVPPERFFIVPGNHDVDRDAIPQERDLAAAMTQRRPDLYSEGVERGLAGTYTKKRILTPFEAFRDFSINGLNKKYGAYDPAFFYFDTFSTEDSSVTVLCINSSLVCGQHRDVDGRFNDYGRLCVGEIHLRSVMKLIPSSDVVIVVMHHPISWLHDLEYNIVEEILAKNSHIVLHGHQHVPRVYSSHTTDGDVVIIPAGACFDEPNPRDSRQVSSYNFVYVDPRERSGTVFLRRLNYKKDSYIADESIWADGRFPFVLPEQYRRDYAERRTALHRAEVAAAPYLGKKFSNFTKIKLTHRIRSAGDLQVVEQDTEYYRKLDLGEESGFCIRSWPDEYIISKSSNNDEVLAYRFCHLSIGDERVDPEIVHGGMNHMRNLAKNPIDIDYRYICHYPVFGMHTTEIGRFTKHLELTINKDTELHYSVEGLGGLVFLPEEIESISDNCDRFTVKRMILPYQSVRVSWHPR